MTTGAVWPGIDRERFVATVWELVGETGTQRDLAQLLDVHPCTITRVLSGQRAPGRKVLVALLRYGVTAAELGLVTDR